LVGEEQCGLQTVIEVEDDRDWNWFWVRDKNFFWATMRTRTDRAERRIEICGFWNWFHAARRNEGGERSRILASRTATVEAAIMQTPFVMVYRVSSLTYLLGKPRVKVPHFAMVNLIASEQVVPELVQHDFTAANVVAWLQEILRDGPSRSRMLDGLVKVKARLRAPESAVEGLEQTPADRADEIILSIRNRRIADE
jgi:hypothetical protein